MSTPMKTRILGCGTSGGVPLIGHRWGNCNPQNPRNRRLRSSILLQSPTTTVLIDSSPDLRQQLLTANVGWVDAVLYTHIHADHVHGINDLVAMGRVHKKDIPLYGDKETLSMLRHSFDYAFKSNKNVAKIYRPYLTTHEMEAGAFTIGDIHIIPFEQKHGDSITWGFRMGEFAYSTDVNYLDKKAFAALEGIKIWVVDCLSEVPHETHAHLDLSLEWIERVKPARAYLTHLGITLDYDALLHKLPPHIKPAFDGLEVTFQGA